MNALSVELELGDEIFGIKESTINKMIQNLPAENSVSISINFSALTLNTLHAEFDGLLDLK